MTISPTNWPFMFRIYKVLARLARPLLTRYAAKKHLEMGAAPERVAERFGVASQARPNGSLIWVNAASLGELRAAQPILERLTDTNVLLTTTSKSAADLAKQILPQNVRHQFAPIDAPSVISAFLNHWRPDLVVFLESDLPLNAIDQLSAQAIPMAVLNARSSKTRARFPRVFSAAFSRFYLVTAQDRATADELRTLGVGADRLMAVTDLKSHAPAPKPQESAVAVLKECIGARPSWLAMSVHPEETEKLASAHKKLRETHPDALLILAPRHPDKAAEFLPALEEFQVSQRSQGALPDQAVYLADTLGEAGALFAVTQVAFIGGTFAPIGGHSPQEALKSGRPVLFGPHIDHHAEAFETAQAAGAARQVENEETLANAIKHWLDADKRQTAETAALSLTNGSDSIVDEIASSLKQVMS